MFTDVPKIQSYVKTINSTAFGGASIVKYNKPRNAYNLPSITGKIDGGIDGVKTIMKKVFGRNVNVEKLTGEIAKKVSGTYDSFSVQMGKEGFYFRSVVSERGSLTDKDLTPNKLQLGGKTLNKQQFETAVEVGLILSDDLPGNIISLGQALLELSKGSGLTIKTNSDVKDLLTATTASDLKKFGKNYGEVIIAHWCLYNKPNAASIYFPPEEANPLADFVVNFTPVSKKPPLNVSAKFEEGANASLSSIIQADSKPPKGATDVELKAFNAIMAVAYGTSIIQGLLDAEILLDTPEYKVIKKMCGTIVTLEAIAKVVETAFASCGISSGMKWDVGSKSTKEKYAKFLEIMEPFYKLIPGKSGGRPDISTIPKIVALPKSKYFHPVLYAFSVALAARFNSNSEFSNVLDKAATSIKAEQLYLEISSNSITIKIKEFSKSKFQFAAGAYAHKADNVRMKVALVK